MRLCDSAEQTIKYRLREVRTRCETTGSTPKNQLFAQKMRREGVEPTADKV